MKELLKTMLQAGRYELIDVPDQVQYFGKFYKLNIPIDQHNTGAILIDIEALKALGVDPPPDYCDAVRYYDCVICESCNFEWFLHEDRPKCLTPIEREKEYDPIADFKKMRERNRRDRLACGADRLRRTDRAQLDKRDERRTIPRDR